MSILTIVDSNTPLGAEAFGTLGDVRAVPTGEFRPDVVKDADILIVRSETRVNEALLRDSKVRFVGTVTIGTDHVDTGYLASRGIGFASAPGSNANSVCEYIVSALLVMARRHGEFLRGRSIGIVGVGHIGTRVARAARSLGMTVLLNDPPRQRAEGGDFVPLDALMDCDVVTLHVPLTKSGEDKTVHLFDRERLSRLKPGAVLINSCRGGVVDNSALLEAIARGRPGGAVLDVWEGEPAINLELLKAADIGTPHIAGYSYDGKTNAVSMVYDAACRALGREPAWKRSGVMLPAPPAPEIVLNSAGPSAEDQIRQAVSACYTIEDDDSALRAVERVRPEDRARYFQSLRATYRVRREFAATRIRCKDGEITKILTDLGFSTAGPG